MSDQYEKLQKQHFDSYKKALLDIVENNTNVLVNEDIKSLLKKPPLNSMDVISTRFLSLAKKNSIILNTDNLVNIIDKYHTFLLKCCDEIKTKRITFLNNIINSYKYNSDNNVIKINKKDFININKVIKNIVKDQLQESYKSHILKNINKIFDNNVDKDLKDKLIKDIEKFLKNQYQKQILESLDIKILVKDTILINSCKEHTDRYVFTLKNSRLLNQM